MESRRLFLLYIIITVTHGVLGEMWEFGMDAPGSIIVDYREDTLSLFEKTKQIKLRTPQCYVMEYVRVGVLNPISNPSVTFDKMTNIVTISYKPLQFSSSSFNIVAKAARKPGCFNQSIELLMRHRFFGK